MKMNPSSLLLLLSTVSLQQVVASASNNNVRGGRKHHQTEGASARRALKGSSSSDDYTEVGNKPYTPSCGSFLFTSDSSTGVHFLVDEDYEIELVHHPNDETHGWCNSVACMGDDLTLAIRGEEIDNGFKIRFATSLIGTTTQMMCPYGNLSPTITEFYCHETQAPSPNTLTFDDIYGPWGEFTNAGGCDIDVVTVECTTDDEDALEAIFDDYKKCDEEENRENGYYTANKFLISNDNDDSEEVLYVDGVEYKLEALRADRAANTVGWCSSTACTGAKWAAYISSGVETDLGVKYVMSHGAVSSTNGDFQDVWMACPDINQTPVVTPLSCDSGTVGDTGTVNPTIYGPVIRDLGATCDGDVMTIEVECQDNEEDNVFWNGN